MSGAVGTVNAVQAQADLVARASAGDGAAFATIVDAYHADLARVAYVVAGDVELAEDAVQAAWSIAWRKLRTLRDPARLRPWLVAVAANEARILVRRRNRHFVVELDLAHMGGCGGDPADRIDRLDLVDALRHLKPEDRALLALRYLAGLDSDEIGPLVGLSASGARRRLSRLLGRLRTELHDA